MTRERPGTNRAFILSGPVWVLALGLTACGESQGGPQGCGATIVCPGQTVCHLGACLPQGAGTGRFALVVIPADGQRHAPREVVDPDLAAAMAQDLLVQVAPSETLTGTLPDTAWDGSRVIVEIPSAVPGRGARLVEVVAQTVAPGAVGFSLRVGPSEKGRLATFRVVPPVNRSGLQPPPFSITRQLAPALVLAPEKTQLVGVQGQLLSAVGDALAGYRTRVLRDGQPASTMDETDQTGHFEVSLAWDSPAPDAGPLTLEFSPPKGQVQPRVLTTFPEPTDEQGANVGPVRQLAVAAVRRFEIPVLGQLDNEPIEDALVTLQTDLTSELLPPKSTCAAAPPRAPRACADFHASGTTASAAVAAAAGVLPGDASVPLLPGSANQPRIYSVAILPRAGSRWRAACHSRYEIWWNDAGPAATLRLTPRARVRTQILRDDGTPAGRVKVTTTPIAHGEGSPCAWIPLGAPLVSLSGRDGIASRYLDPGRARVTYTPPATSPLPRLTEEITVDAAEDGDTATMDTPPVRLPAPGLVKGRADSADGAPLTAAAVRLYRVSCEPSDCSGAAQADLVAESWTDDAGVFKLVAPIE